MLGNYGQGGADPELARWWRGQGERAGSGQGRTAARQCGRPPGGCQSWRSRAARAAAAGRRAGRAAAAHRAVLRAGNAVAGLPGGAPGRPAAGRGVLPGALAARQGGALDARGELHRLVLVEGVRQGRDHHLGDPADRLSLDRPRLTGVRAPGMSARSLVLLVHLLTVAGALPVRARPAAGDVAGGPREAARPGSRPGRRSRATRSARPGTRARAAWAGSSGPPGPR